MASKQMKPVKGWAWPIDGKISHSHILNKSPRHMAYIPVIIAPTATHAVVPLSAVDILQHVSDPKHPKFDEGVRYALAFLGLKVLPFKVLPKPPKRKAKCRTCGGEGDLTVGGADHIKCWTCNGGKGSKRSKPNGR